MKPLKILVVDDCLTSQVIQTKMLENMEHEVVVASGCKRALRALNMFQFDIILMDLNMPEIDGYQCCQEIQNLNITTPIIALSGCDPQQLQDKCFAAGMSAYLKKPTNKLTFEHVIQQLLN